ncbi:hypothetical protein C8R47DRAFT_336783 [Mycena vitilis]|nr:hypothetical protein C8R47DRAFT_336783 [Mycena vitilis]
MQLLRPSILATALVLLTQVPQTQLRPQPAHHHSSPCMQPRCAQQLHSRASIDSSVDHRRRGTAMRGCGARSSRLATGLASHFMVARQAGGSTEAAAAAVVRMTGLRVAEVHGVLQGRSQPHKAHMERESKMYTDACQSHPKSHLLPAQHLGESELSILWRFWRSILFRFCVDSRDRVKMTW